MKRGLVFLFLAAALAARAADSPERVFTLAQSVQTALQNNQALLSAREGVRLAKQRIEEAHALVYPSLALNLNASRYLSVDRTVLTSEFGSTILRPSMNGEADNFYSGRLSLRQVLYNGGRTLTNTRLAQANLAQSRIREEEILRQVMVDATTAFYDELLAGRQLALSEAAAQDLRSLAAAIPARDDTARVILEGIQARLRRDQAARRRQEEKASLAFSSTLGIELYTRVGLEGALESRPIQVDLAKLLARAQEARLEIRGTDYQREMDRLAVNLTEAERYPVVALMAGYEMSDRRFPLETNYWNTTLNVGLPLFDGFASRARIRQSRLIGNQSRIERAAVEDRIAREVREAHGDLLYWQDEADARRADLERLEAMYAKLPAGRILAQKAEARLELLLTAQAYWESVHGHRLAQARLEKAVGMVLDR